MSLVLEVFSTDTMSELDILGHYGNALCVDCAKVRILQEASQILLCSLLQSQDHMHLELQIIFATSLVIAWDQT